MISLLAQYHFLACIVIVRLVLVVFFRQFYFNIFSRTRQFFVVYSMFLLSMLCMLFGLSWYSLVVGWEVMGVFSFLLISWFNGRSMARNGASLALLSNRVRDIVLFRGLLMRPCLLYVFGGGLTKSAMWVFSSWLPNAMEGPTPVSALLHSSTMVVARVYLISIMNYAGAAFFVLLIYGAYMRLIRGNYADYKRIIAYSTSSQLVLVGVIAMLGSEMESSMYVEAHAYFKSLLFMFCGWIIHANYVQHINSNYNNQIIMRCVFMCCANMCGMPMMSVSRMKDVLLLRNRNYSFHLIFFFYAMCTLYYSASLRKPRRGESIKFIDGCFILSALLLYSLFSYYVVDLFGLLARAGCFRLLVLSVLLYSGLILRPNLAYSSVDIPYKFKGPQIRLYHFGSFIKSKVSLKETGCLIVLRVLLLI